PAIAAISPSGLKRLITVAAPAPRSAPPVPPSPPLTLLAALAPTAAPNSLPIISISLFAFRALNRRARRSVPLAPGECTFAFGKEAGHDLGDGFLACDHADGLARHQAAVLDIAIDRRAAERAGPVALDLQLRFGHFDAAFVEYLRDLALLGGEKLRSLVPERADREHREARIDLDAGDGVARIGAAEGLLEFGMGDRFGRAGEARVKPHASRAHLEVAGDRFAATDAAGDEDQVLVAQRGQELLREDAGGNRTDVAACLHALDNQRVGAGAEQLLGQGQRGGKDDDLAAERLDRLDAALGRNAAGQRDVADAVLGADFDQLEQVRMHGDQVDAERFGGERLGAGDFAIEQFGRHGAAGDHPEPAGVADRGHEV